MCTQSLRDRGRLFDPIVVMLVLIASGASLVAIASAGDEITVQREDETGTTTIIVPSKHGLLRWNDVMRGLARAARLDDQALSDDWEREYLDLTQPSSRLAIRALSAAVPDVHIRVIDHVGDHGPALQVRFDRDDARQKVRHVKALVREQFGGDRDAYDLSLDEGWEQKPQDRPLVVSRPGQLVLPRIDAFFSGLEELQSGKGDTVVSVARGRLEGVEDTLLLPVNHWTITANHSPAAQTLLYETVVERIGDR